MSPAKKKKVKKVVKKKSTPKIDPVDAAKIQADLDRDQEMVKLVDRNTELREQMEAIADDKRKALLRAETAEGKVEKLKDRIKHMKPPKLDAEKLEAAVNTVLLSLLMDAKGALSVTMDPAMAKVAVKIQQAEISMAPLVLAETMVVQRAKSLAQKMLSGLEIDDDEVENLLKFAERLL